MHTATVSPLRHHGIRRRRASEVILLDAIISGFRN